MKIAITFLVLFVFFSCGKFEHPELDIIVPCELCAWADGIEGHYEGTHVYHLQTNSQDSVRIDSVFIDVAHVYLYSNAYHDSTVMYFEFTKYLDSLTDPNPATYLVAASDSIDHFKSNTYAIEFITSDSIRAVTGTGGSWPSWYLITYGGTVYRQ